MAFKREKAIAEAQKYASKGQHDKAAREYQAIVDNDPKDLGKPRSKMRQDERLLVYKRDQCLRCDELIEAWTLAGRTIYACPRCQI